MEILKKEKTISIYEAITYHYQDFMKIAKREYNNLYKAQRRIDEDDDSYKDIAHTTLMKMCDIFDKIALTLNHAKSYFCKAVRMNYVHETLTVHHKCVDYKDFSDYENTALMVAEPETQYEASIDLERIFDDIIIKFGERNADIFKRFMEGDTLKELDKEYNIHNSDYIVRKIRKYIRGNYPGFCLNRFKSTTPT